MKYRFSLEVIFPHSTMTQEEVEALLDQMITAGQRLYGHSSGTMGFALEKLRARSIDPSKPVGEQE
jgi:hypothetical protein